jgi:hypothetical protein
VRTSLSLSVCVCVCSALDSETLHTAEMRRFLEPPEDLPQAAVCLTVASNPLRCVGTHVGDYAMLIHETHHLVCTGRAIPSTSICSACDGLWCSTNDGVRHAANGQLHASHANSVARNQLYTSSPTTDNESARENSS